MGFLNFFKKKKKQDNVPEENSYNIEEPHYEEPPRYEDLLDKDADKENPPEERYSDPSFDDYRAGNTDNPFADTEQNVDTTPLKEESRRGRRLKGGLIAGIVAVIAMGTVGVMAYNFMKPRTDLVGQQRQQQSSQAGKTARETALQSSELPGSYSDLAKYEQERQRKEREQKIRTGQLNPAKEQREKVLAGVQARKQAEARREVSRQPSVTPPARPSMPAPGTTGPAQRQAAVREQDKYKEFNTPVGFKVTEGGKVENGSSAVFSALPGTGQATGKKYTLTTGTVIPVTMLTGLTSDSKSAGVTAQVRQDVYDSLTGTHLLIPQGSKVVGTGGGVNGRRMSVQFNRIILPNGASIKLSGSHATDGQGYSGLKDKYDEKWGPAMRGAFLSGIITGIADWVGDLDTKYDKNGNAIQSGWSQAAENISNRLGDKADALDKNESPAVKIRPGFQFQVYLTADIDIFQYKPLLNDPR